MKDTIEGNKSIAVFLSRQTGNKIITSPTRMNYHSNWNSLMTVRNEVKKLGVSVVINDGCQVNGLGYNQTTNIEGATERQNVWSAMVDFLAYYKAKSATPKEAKTEAAKVTQEV